MKFVKRFTLALSLLTVSGLAFGQTPAPAKGSSPKTPAVKSAPAAEKPAMKPIDVNRASMSELKSVPGIGDAYASKIVAGRPYKSKAQLKSRNILPDAVYEKVKDNIVAKQ